MSSYFLRLLLFLTCLVAATRSTCNVCNSVNKMACYSMTQTKVCDANNLPSGAPFDCPPGYMCVSGSGGVLCQPKAPSSNVADCQDCNKCDASQTFACTGTRSFALCLGTNVPQQSRGNCASGYVCNNGIKEICELATSVNPSCSTVDDTTTTTAPTTPPTPSTNDAAAYCAAVKKQGNFAVGEFTETTCRQYIQCSLTNGKWVGKKYACAGSTFFDRTVGQCVTNKPSYCYTPTTNPPTTTTAAPTTSNPAAYCAKLQSQGYFPVGTNPKTTCHQYIKCYQLSGSWLGKGYTCPGNLYYNSSTKTCVSTLPATCSDRIESISLNGVELE
ncbi:uncharacterized protein LOC117787539 [Drosophila innubila]|uniref:uncharacterized protein LOC117787539 n=1 Tax=Drosophila innubila TaxID=198719 RepID=UPI00148BFF71|nr:uncharacterized protein LOC117787539 [Drosophila innubila]